MRLLISRSHLVRWPLTEEQVLKTSSRVISESSIVDSGDKHWEKVGRDGRFFNNSVN